MELGLVSYSCLTLSRVRRSATDGLNLNIAGYLIAPSFSVVVFFFKNGQNNTY